MFASKDPNGIIRSVFEESPESDIEEIKILDVDETLFSAVLTLEERTG